MIKMRSLTRSWSSYTFVFFSSLVLLKIYIKLTTGVYHGNKRLNGKTAIVTGGSAGIGAECVKDFATRGARVIMTGRDMTKAAAVRDAIIKETGNPNIVLKELNFKSLANVRECAENILAEEPRIDILLNNAGSAPLSKGYTEDGLDKLMQANYFGPFLFTNILLGRIIESAPSRIVNVSSLAHIVSDLKLSHLDCSNTNIGFIMYANTKVANILFSNELAEKLKGTGVTVNSLHPGVVMTSIVRRAGFMFTTAWNSILTVFFKDTREGAQTSIYACVSAEVENTTGKYFSDCGEAKTSYKANIPGKARKLWDLSEVAVKLRPCERHV